MTSKTFSTSLLVLAIAIGTSSTQAASLQSAATVLKSADIKTVEFSATGRWYQFGQAPAPSLAWPQFDVSRYVADINYEKGAARVQITRKQTLETGRNRPAPVEQKPDQYISNGYAWNLAPPANATVDTAPIATTQPTAIEERNAEILSTPQGFLKAAVANKATEKKVGDTLEVSFTVSEKYHYVGVINANNYVESIKTWIDNPVLGDTLYETHFSDYQNFSGTPFPRHLVRNQGGYPVLDINISDVKTNLPVEVSAPQNITDAKSAQQNVVVTKLAEGVFYLTGGTHHSVAIEQKDHIVLVESPLNEARSIALIDKIKETFPNKPIKYLINTHAHFDHSGGLRTFVDAGATIVTHKTNEAYYKKIWAEPHTLNPDRLATSKKAAHFETFTGKYVLSDGKRTIEIYPIDGNSHNDAFALIYLPAEKILIEADAYTALAAGATPPATINPYSLNLYENIQKLKLDVDQIAGIHGPGVVKLADLKAYIGITKS